MGAQVPFRSTGCRRYVCAQALAAPRSAEVTPGTAGVIANSPLPPPRQPVDDDVDPRDLPVGEGEQEEPVVRDQEFYIDSADCVIRVDNMLFKVSMMLLISCPLDFTASSLVLSTPPRVAAHRSAAGDSGVTFTS